MPKSKLYKVIVNGDVVFSGSYRCCDSVFSVLRKVVPDFVVILALDI